MREGKIKAWAIESQKARAWHIPFGDAYLQTDCGDAPLLFETEALAQEYCEEAHCTHGEKPVCVEITIREG